MIKGADFSSNKKYRYSLHRFWDTSKPLVMFIMLNPSIADGKEDDPTIRRVINYAKSWGYGGFYVCNLFAYVSTDSRVLKSLGHFAIGKENDSKILQVSLLCDKIIFAWGRKGSLFGRSSEVVNMFKEAYYLSMNKDGEPAHPLFLPNNLIPKLFIKNQN